MVNSQARRGAEPTNPLPPPARQGVSTGSLKRTPPPREWVLMYRSEYRAGSRMDLALCSTMPCGKGGFGARQGQWETGKRGGSEPGVGRRRKKRSLGPTRQSILFVAALGYSIIHRAPLPSEVVCPVALSPLPPREEALV